MKKYLLITITLLLTLAFAKDDAEYKENLIASCIASENSQTACKCLFNRMEKELTPEVWEAFMTLMTPKGAPESGKEITYEGSETEHEVLLAILEGEGAEEQMTKILADCNVKKPITVVH